MKREGGDAVAAPIVAGASRAARDPTPRAARPVPVAASAPDRWRLSAAPVPNSGVAYGTSVEGRPTCRATIDTET